MRVKKHHKGTHQNSKTQLASTVLSAIGPQSVTVSFRFESESAKRTPRDGGERAYLVTEDRDTNVPFLIDPRVVDLRREFHLHRR